MPNIAIQLPAGIGEGVIYAGQVVLITAWRLTRPRFLLGGSLDRAPQLSLQVITGQGDELWLAEADVTGLSEPALVSIYLPFMAGDAVRVSPSPARGEVIGWVATGRRLGVEVVYRVHLAGTSAEDELEVDAGNLQPW